MNDDSDIASRRIEIAHNKNIVTVKEMNLWHKNLKDLNLTKEEIREVVRFTNFLIDLKRKDEDSEQNSKAI